jgi:hypothetical protein
MIRNLRKGTFQLELNHAYGTDTVCAMEAQINFDDGIVAFKAKLKPISDNQLHDANRFKENDFKDVEFFSLRDPHIRKGISTFIKANKSAIEAWSVVIEFGRDFTIDCEIQALEPDGVMFHPI